MSAARADAEIDRARAVRVALRRLVADGGFHGTAVSAIATEARVAAGTVYTYYASKDELVLATYAETKAEVGAAATEGLDPGAAPDQRFRAIWLNTYRHLAAHRDHALFLLQVDYSPYKGAAHAAVRDDDPLLAEASKPDLAARLAPLPLDVLYELGLSPAVRLAAAGTELSEGDLEAIADACWRAVSAPRGNSIDA